MTSAGADEARWRVTEAAARGWTFLTNHAHVLLVLTSSPGMRLRDVADAVGITERAAQRIVAELEAAGYLTRIRVGRRNEYRVHPDLPLRHPLEAAHPVRRLLEVLGPVSLCAVAAPARGPGEATGGGRGERFRQGSSDGDEVEGGDDMTERAAGEGLSDEEMVRQVEEQTSKDLKAEELFEQEASGVGSDVEAAKGGAGDLE